jgi:hypothetical protein
LSFVCWRFENPLWHWKRWGMLGNAKCCSPMGNVGECEVLQSDGECWGMRSVAVRWGMLGNAKCCSPMGNVGECEVLQSVGECWGMRSVAVRCRRFSKVTLGRLHETECRQNGVWKTIISLCFQSNTAVLYCIVLYYIMHLTGLYIRSLEHHQAIFARSLKQVTFIRTIWTNRMHYLLSTYFNN